MEFARYRWIVTKDHTGGTRTGTKGPWNAPRGLEVADRWLTKDGDGNLVYEGYIGGDYDGFEPLNDLAGPDAGATEIYYKNAQGNWEIL
jgi:hypothetical protein